MATIAETRRRFLQGAAGAIACGATAQDVPAGRRPRIAPAHLPDRLAICYIGWEWIAAALPDEPYGDLERVMTEVKRRGFNTVRAEMGLNWMFDLKGRRRGKMKFRGWVEGASSNLQCQAFTKGGGVHDVFERVVRLFELARKHDLYVITTSWEYQDALAHVADARIRDEIVSVPYSDRMMLLAQQYDRLLREIRKRKLENRIAFVEVINEFNSPPIFCASPGVPNQTYEHWVSAKVPEPQCPPGQLRELAHKAVALLRERHPELLTTVDFGSARQFQTMCPDNAQIADHHVYTNGLTQAFWTEAGIPGIRRGAPPDPDKNEFLKKHLKPARMSWEEIQRRGAHVRSSWLPIAWLYENLDDRKFDEWALAHHARYADRIRQSITDAYRIAADFARAKNLPLVVDEGGILYPPVRSKFVMTPEGRSDEEAFVDGAIATGHWGILPTGYTRPDTLTWHDESQIDWIRRVNRRILETKGRTMGA